MREASLAAYAHQELPFAKLVEELRPARELGRAPLAQVLFTLQNAPMQGLAFDGLSWEAVAVDRGGAPFELSLYVDAETTRGLLLEYSTELFDEATIARMAGHYRQLLEAFVREPEAAVSAPSLLTEGEVRWLLRGQRHGGRASRASGRPGSWWRPRSPGRPARWRSIFGDDRLTYAELDARANQLARRLRTLGVGPGCLVGLCVERSLDMVVGLLAILKAGGAYLPLDPGYPRERLAFMLEDAQVAAVLAHAAARGQPPARSRPRWCSSTRSARPSPRCPPARWSPWPDRDDLAYVIYTSGSTGRPKGVEVLQRGARQPAGVLRADPGLAPGDLLLSVTTISFDIASLEVFLPLVTGAPSASCPTAVASDGARLAEVLASSGATFMQATPATWRMLVDAGGAATGASAC